MTKTFLITGGAGYIGSHVALALLDRGYGVVVLDDLSTGHARLVPPGATFFQGDVGDADLLAKIFAQHCITGILHFAAKLIVPESVSNPVLYYDNNVGKFSRLLAATTRAGIENIIFSSTAAVYGAPEQQFVTEDTPLVPINPYGASKAMAERVLADAAAAHGLRYVTLRYFNVAGADAALRSGLMSENATHLVKVAAEVAAGKRPHLQIFGTDYPTPDGTAVRDYIHVSDLADAHVLALEHLLQGGESLTLNCGYGHGASVRDVVMAVEAVTGQTLAVQEAPRRAGDPPMLVADSRALRERLGWQPRFDDLQRIVESALAWEKTLEKKDG